MAARHAELRMPVLLVWRQDDPTFPIGRARAMIRQLAGCRGVIAVPGTKLLPHEEKPEIVARVVREFCTRPLVAVSTARRASCRRLDRALRL